MFDLNDYDYELSPELIAQSPVLERDRSRLLVINGSHGSFEDRMFCDILDRFRPGDRLVINDTRVFPARLSGTKPTGGKLELFLLEYPGLPADPETAASFSVTVKCLLKSSKRPKPGSGIVFDEKYSGQILEYLGGGEALVRLEGQGGFEEFLEDFGQVPLPPYIKREKGTSEADRERYQTVFAVNTGAVAAPTAGLHFTPDLLDALAGKGIGISRITLHVGHGTFVPVRVDDIRDHKIHAEYVSITRQTADQIKATRERGGRIWAVGTTTARLLEYAANVNGELEAGEGWCDLYIYPGYRFRVVDNLITNFHLPKSSLLFLVSALAGRERILQAYHHAVSRRYRFYSYGDAMAIIMKP